jgi:hypothetical protein
MPVVIQQLETGLFWGENGDWVKDQSRAKDFERSGVAIVHCVKERLMNVRVGMLFGDPEMDVYYYPFKGQKTREGTQTLRKEASALKENGNALVQKVRAARAALAQHATTLPLRRKKKREDGPIEE